MISYQRQSNLSPFRIDYDVHVSETEIKMRFTENLPNDPIAKTAQAPKVWEETVYLRAVQQGQNWIEGNILLWAMKFEQNPPGSAGKGQAGRPFTLRGPINVVADTFTSKDSINAWYASNGIQSLFGILVPHAQADFKSAGIFFNIGTTSHFKCNEKTHEQTAVQTFNATMPWLKIAGPTTIKAGSTQTLGLKCTVGRGGKAFQASVAAHLQALAGYLPKNRLEIKGGEAQFKVMALGLEPGDQIRVKAGLKFYSGMDEHVLQVIA